MALLTYFKNITVLFLRLQRTNRLQRHWSMCFSVLGVRSRAKFEEEKAEGSQKAVYAYFGSIALEIWVFSSVYLCPISLFRTAISELSRCLDSVAKSLDFNMSFSTFFQVVFCGASHLLSLLQRARYQLENERGNFLFKKNRVNQSTLANTYESASQNRLSISKNQHALNLRFRFSISNL